MDVNKACVVLQAIISRVGVQSAIACQQVHCWCHASAIMFSYLKQYLTQVRCFVLFMFVSAMHVCNVLPVNWQYA